MRRYGTFAAFAALVFADLWTAATLWNAVTVSDGHGPVFWTAVVLIALLFIGLLWATRKVAGRLRAS